MLKLGITGELEPIAPAREEEGMEAPDSEGEPDRTPVTETPVGMRLLERTVLCAGQLVTSGPHEMTVNTAVEYKVTVDAPAASE